MLFIFSYPHECDKKKWVRVVKVKVKENKNSVRQADSAVEEEEGGSFNSSSSSSSDIEEGDC